MNHLRRNLFILYCLTSVHDIIFGSQLVQTSETQQFDTLEKVAKDPNLFERVKKNLEKNSKSQLTEVVKKNLKLHKVPGLKLKDVLEFLEVPVLQQRSDQPFMLNRKNLETEGDGTILGQSGLLWKNVRMYDNTNCAYHALKNIRFMLTALQDQKIDVSKELNNKDSLLNQQLLQTNNFYDDLATGVSQIFQKRKKEVCEALKLPIDSNNLTMFKNGRSRLSDRLKSYVNSNDGYIKVDDLSGDEVESLIQPEGHEIQNNVVVIEYFPEISELVLTNKVKKRIENFKKFQNDTLAIIWNEDDFHHWVSYVAHKTNGKITIYEMNSISGKNPANVSKLFNALMSSSK